MHRCIMRIQYSKYAIYAEYIRICDKQCVLLVFIKYACFFLLTHFNLFTQIRNQIRNLRLRLTLIMKTEGPLLPTGYLAPPFNLILMNYIQTTKLRTDKPMVVADPMSRMAIAYRTSRMSTPNMQEVKANIIPCPATFRSSTASLQGGVLISSSMFILPDGPLQCLGPETFCTAPKLAG
jgi:hypothetical protein